MIVYLYEKLSQNLNHFVDPRPMDSINISYYVSNGYLVFTPDIVYTTGYPGQSALKCVLGGVNAVTARGFVDEKNIGIQGHSWGGYQIAYMVTQTNRFKAAEDGAPVANMISAYDGIRWGSGRPRQFQYEKTQSRIGGSIWEYPAPLHRQLPHLPRRPHPDPAPHPPQRRRRRRPLVPGHRVLPRSPPPRQTRLDVLLQRRAPSPPPPRQPARLRRPHGRVLRLRTKIRPQTRMDGKRHPLPPHRRNKPPHSPLQTKLLIRISI